MTPTQFTQLVHAARSTRYATLIELLVHTELHRGEDLALRSPDVDFLRETLRVRGTLARVDGAPVVTQPQTARLRVHHGYR